MIDHTKTAVSEQFTTLLNKTDLHRVKERMCQGKLSYESKESAKRGAKRTKAGGGGDMKPYPCPFCCRFHVGSSRKRGLDSFADLRKSVKASLEFYSPPP